MAAGRYEHIAERLRAHPERWLVTGVAGFIGSGILHRLLDLNQEVVGLDNFATGRRENLDDVRARVSEAAWQRFEFRTGDIVQAADDLNACRGVTYVLHQAALGSVPRSLQNPQATHEANATGTLNLLHAAREAGVRRVVYASSSSVYGDSAELPRVEARVGNPLSPYAASKRACELYASSFTRALGLPTVGLRYFNVFGPRQNPEGPYAAVIPRWIANLLADRPCTIYGDGRTSRDFCYLENAVQANLLAATAEAEAVAGDCFNVGSGEALSLLELHASIVEARQAARPGGVPSAPRFEANRAGDVAHSLADLSRAREHLGYFPSVPIRAGLKATVDWYVQEHMG